MLHRGATDHELAQLPPPAITSGPSSGKAAFRRRPRSCACRSRRSARRSRCWKMRSASGCFSARAARSCSPTSAASWTATPTEIFTAGGELLETLKGRPSGRAPQLPSASRMPCRSWSSTACCGRRRRAPSRRRSRAAKAIPISSSPNSRRTRSTWSSATRRPRRTSASRCSTTCSASPGRRSSRDARWRGALRRRFPRSLNGAPMLLPTINTALRRALEQWFEAEGLHPVVAGEFEDRRC